MGNLIQSQKYQRYLQRTLFILLFMTVWANNNLHAQTQNKMILMEYRWNDDPPSFTDVIPTSVFTYNLNITAPSTNGIHILRFRFMDSLNRWGPYQSVRVRVGEQMVAQKIVSGEYYWSSNPSARTPFDFDDTTAIHQLINDISAPATPGIHTLWLRFKDSRGQWGLARNVRVRVGEQMVAQKIVSGEYYWSSNPSARTPFDFDDTTSVHQLINDIPAPATPGIHTLWLRFKDSRGQWGLASNVRVVVSSLTAGIKITTGEYYWAHDRNTRYSLGIFDSSYISFTLNNLQGILTSNGADTLFVILKDNQGRNTLLQRIPVLVDAGQAPPVISAGEYYFNSQPSQPFTTGTFGGTTISDIAQPVAISQTGLGIGLHTVSVRLKNDRNEWSAVRSDTFRIRIKPVITLSRNSINYGTVAVNDSVSQTVSIRNDGDDTLKITNISISPSGLGYGFASSGSLILHGSGDSIVVRVWLKPTSEGEKNATLTIQNNDETKTVTLTANAVLNPYPTIAVSTDSLVFKGVQVGRDSTLTFQVSNTGTTPFNITNITSSHSAFTVTSPATFPVTVNIGSPRTVQVKFTPTAFVQYSGQLTISNTSNNNPIYTLPMSGEGTTGPPARTIVVSPDTVDFGMVTKDSTQTRFVTISNTGNSTLSVTSVSSGHAVFTVINPPSVSNPLIVKADSSKNITIRFSPVAVTNYQSTLTIQSDATNTPTVTRVIRGRGVAGPTPNILLSTSALNFGNLKTGLKDTLHFTLTNTGNADLNVTSMLVSHNVFRVLSATAFVLTPSGSREIAVEFAPLAGVTYNATLTIKSNTTDAILNLTGTGAELGVGVNPGSINPVASAGESVLITITPTAPILWARLYFKQGGAVKYDSVSMNPVGGGSYSGSIPSLYITYKGVSYYIRIADATETKTAPAVDPEKNPYTVYVQMSNGLAKTTVQPAGNKTEYYRMISLPIDVTQGDADSVLSNFGPANINVWRLFRWQGTTTGYVEHTDPAFENFAPGRGYWFITTRGIALRSGPGKTVSTSEPFTIALQNGWNMIGNPYPYTIPWDSVQKTAQIQTPYTYDDDGSGKITYIPATVLEPWKGYFVKNISPNPVNIGIPPIEKNLLLVKNLYAGNYHSGNGWMLRIRASSGKLADDYNYVGAAADALDTWDQRDQVDAPRHPDEYIQLSFPHPEWMDYPDDYGVDIRKVNHNGHVWDFEVKVKSEQNETHLEFEGTDAIPANFSAVLIDKDLAIAKNIREYPSYTFPVGNKETTRHFRLIVGQEQFISDHDLGITTVPARFELSHNFPNPFNMSTAFKYALPTRAFVTIRIYNALGQEVRTIAAQDQPAGRYLIRWDGTNQKGYAVSSGIYLCRMTAVPYDKKFRNFYQSRKMILMK